MLRKLLFFISFLFLINIRLAAQSKQVTNQSLYWMRYYNQLNINKKWAWHNEFDDRRFFENNRQHNFIMHTRLHYKFVQNADFGFALTYSHQSPQEPNSTSHLIVPEIRPNQEINYNIPISKRLSIQQRFRIDERFIRKNDGKILLDGYNFNFRFRYRLQLNYILNKKETKTPTTLKIADELMINAGHNIIYNQFDQNRLYLAIQQGISSNFSFELGYLHWYQQRPSGYQFIDREIIRLTLYQKINLKK